MNNFMGFRKELAKTLAPYADKTITIKKGEILFLDDFSEDKIAILTKGMINYNNSLQPGKEISLGCYSVGAILILGSIFEECSFSRAETSSYNISASTASTIAFISIDTFKNKISKNKDLLYNLYRFYGLFHEKNFYQLRDLQIFNTEDRLLALVLRAFNTYGKTIDGLNIINRKIFNTNIAKCLDTTEETVSRTFSSLRRQNILSKKDGFWVIQDLDKLKERLGCKYCNQYLCYL